MTNYEYLQVVKGVATTMHENHIKASDIQYLPMIADYHRLKGEGHKLTWIVAYLCDYYDIGQTKFYRLLGEMQKPVILPKV